MMCDGAKTPDATAAARELHDKLWPDCRYCRYFGVENCGRRYETILAAMEAREQAVWGEALELAQVIGERDNAMPRWVRLRDEFRRRARGET